MNISPALCLLSCVVGPVAPLVTLSDKLTNTTASATKLCLCTIMH